MLYYWFWFQRIISALTFRRLWNVIVVNFYYALSNITKRPYANAKPISISIEPTTTCNLKCPECPSGLRKFSRKTGTITDQTINRIIDQFSKELIYVTFYFQGEPLLHPKFAEYVKLLKKEKLIIGTSTNAHFLTEETSKNIIDSGLDRLIISLDGSTAETYKKYRKGGDFDLVLKNIKAFMKQKKELKANFPFVELQFIVFKHNEHQIEDIKTLAKDLGVDTLSLKTAQLYEFEDGNDLMPGLVKYSRYEKQENGKYRIKSKLPNKCHRSATTNVITWDGNVVPCCFDKDADHKFGNIMDEDYDTIRKSKTYLAFRKQILTDRSKIEICRNCSEGL